jgi:hypothetical protein
MAIETIAEYGEPDPERGEPAAQGQARVRAGAGLQAQATAAIMRLVRDDPAVAREVQGMIRARIYVDELTRRSGKARESAADAEQHESSLAVKLDPGGHRTLSFGLGTAVVVSLMILDAVPLNWAAQAFDLNPAGTWLVTFILVAASIGAMLGFELTRGNQRRRGVLAGVVTAGYLALLGLRSEFLTTVAGDSLLIALLQSALLTAISVGLLWCGSAVLGRTRSLAHSRARAGARRAAQAGEEARAAEFQGTEILARHVGSIHHMLFPRALSSVAPEGVDHAEWAAALRQAIHTVFPAPLPATADRDWPLAALSEPQDAGPAQFEGARPGGQDGVELSS